MLVHEIKTIKPVYKAIRKILLAWDRDAIITLEHVHEKNLRITVVSDKFVNMGLKQRIDAVIAELDRCAPNICKEYKVNVNTFTLIES